jgi:hypothetical protein
MQKVSNYKVSVRVEVPLEYQGTIGSNHVYLVPINKNYTAIRPDFAQEYKSDEKKAVAYLEHGNPTYNGMVRIYPDGTFSQYRDGCFYEYVGRVAI